jgi:hypothetical protein
VLSLPHLVAALGWWSMACSAGRLLPGQTHTLTPPTHPLPPVNSFACVALERCDQPRVSGGGGGGGKTAVMLEMVGSCFDADGW